MRILITAGPTREFIDPVRFISNRSTGKMGFALATAAAEAGFVTTLIAGPVMLATPQGVRRIDIVSARDMLDAVKAQLPEADMLIMSAAVADWRPKYTAESKLKKATMNPTLELEANPDILRAISPEKHGKFFIGFAAETGDPTKEARRKLLDKGLDMVVANDVSAPDSGFATDTNRVILVTADGCQAIPLMSKLDVARKIIAVAIEKLKSSSCPGT